MENTGIKMTIRRVFAGNPTEETVYIQVDRKRKEFRNYFGRQNADGSRQWVSGPRLAAITRCDLGQFFELNLDAAEYVAAPYPPKPLATGLHEPERFQPGRPTLRIETTTTDTGERKEFFGHAARHVIITRKQIPLEGSQSQPQETVTDGSYIDLDLRVSCDRKLSNGKRHGYAAAGKQRLERPEFVDIGEPETGFGVRLLTVSKGAYTLPNGTKRRADSRSETLVTELEQGPLDSALFEIPPHFRHVKQIERNPK
jgi:hypothetical protein